MSHRTRSGETGIQSGRRERTKLHGEARGCRMRLSALLPAKSCLHSRLALAIVAVAACSGCATYPLADLDGRVSPSRHPIRRVRLSPDIRFASQMRVAPHSGAGAGTAAAVGFSAGGLAVGGAAAGLAAGLGQGIANERARKVETMVEERMDLGAYVSRVLPRAFLSSLRHAAVFDDASADTGSGADAELLLIVQRCEFGYARRRQRVPVLEVRGVLVLNPPFTPIWGHDARGNVCSLQIEQPERHPVVWQKRAYSAGGEGIPSYTMAAFLDHPDRVRTAFSAACEQVVDQLIADLSKAYGQNRRTASE